MNTILAITILTILTAFIVIYMIYKENENSKYILATNCIKPSGAFAVENGFTYTTTDDILSTCYDGQSKCTFTGITSLSDAINVCNVNNLCSRFAYNPSTQIVTFLKADSSYTKNTQTDIYNRQ